MMSAESTPSRTVQCSGAALARSRRGLGRRDRAGRARRAALAGSALPAAVCVFLGSRGARAEDELPPPPPPPVAAEPPSASAAPEPEDETSEPAEPPGEPAEARPAGRTKPRKPRANPDATAPWSSADTPPSDWTPRDPAPRTEEVWYGHQTLIVDGLFVSCLLIGVGTETAEVTGTGAFGYLFGGPVVHWVHGEGGRGFGSFGYRVGLPFVGLLLGESASSGAEGGFSGGVVGLGIGMSAAIVLDAALAYELVPVKEKKKRHSLALQPTFGWSPTALTLGLAGTL